MWTHVCEASHTKVRKRSPRTRVTASDNTALPTVYGALKPLPGSRRGLASSTKSPGYSSTISGESYSLRSKSEISGSGLMLSKVSWILRPKNLRNSFKEATCLHQNLALSHSYVHVLTIFLLGESLEFPPYVNAWEFSWHRKHLV